MKLFKTTLLIFLVSIYSYAQSNHLDKDKIEEIDNLFKKWDNPDSPGAAIGIIQNGKMLYSKGYGVANLEHHVPNTSQTAFSIASNSKQFTAACIVLLSQQGKLDLNQSLYSIYPDFPEYAKTISVKNLLHHTSGLRDYPQLAYLSGLRPNDYYNDDDIMKWLISQKELNFPSGEEYLYCNSGYWLLGQIVQKVSGLSLAEFAKNEIFEPLGMSNTHFHDNSATIINNRATGYGLNRSGAYVNFISTQENVGATGIYTTVEDIKKWDDEFYDQKVLNDSFWKLMTSQGVLNNGEMLEYASGLKIKEYKGLKTIDHGGRLPGYWSDIIRFPEQKFTVVVFTNRSDAAAAPLGYQIADIFLKDKLIAKVEKTEPKRDVKFITLSNKTLEKYVASYWNEEEKQSRKVFLKNDTLMFQRGPRNINPLVPIGKNEFKVLGTPPFFEVYVTFEKTEKNYQFKITVNADKGAPYMVYTPVVYRTKDLQSFLGKYYSKEVDAYYEFKMEGDNIRLYINGRETVQLRHIRDELFTSPMCDFQFKKTNDKIDEFTVETPRVKGLRFMRVQ
ncbi:MAG: CubicO group peptidase (beta-lactamase class C family) [Pseudohongiellaceae bacterium]|jgi:CubicO group peptidase (beta-lactamase class C family)